MSMFSLNSFLLRSRFTSDTLCCICAYACTYCKIVEASIVLTLLLMTGFARIGKLQLGEGCSFVQHVSEDCLEEKAPL